MRPLPMSKIKGVVVCNFFTFSVDYFLWITSYGSQDPILGRGKFFVSSILFLFRFLFEFLPLRFFE